MSEAAGRGALMFEVGAHSAEGLGGALAAMLDGTSFSLEVLPAAGEHELVYDQTDAPLAQVVREFRRGTLRSFRIRPRQGTLAWILLFAPHFDGSGRDWWSMVVEQVAGDGGALFDLLCAQAGPEFVVVSLEETLDAAAPDAGPELASHPWLVAAAFAGPDGRLERWPGPRYALLKAV